MGVTFKNKELFEETFEIGGADFSFLFYFYQAHFLPALMGIKHSSRCMLLRRKMAESESSEVSVRDSF